MHLHSTQNISSTGLVSRSEFDIWPVYQLGWVKLWYYNKSQILTAYSNIGLILVHSMHARCRLLLVDIMADRIATHRIAACFSLGKRKDLWKALHWEALLPQDLTHSLLFLLHKNLLIIQYVPKDTVTTTDKAKPKTRYLYFNRWVQC